MIPPQMQGQIIFQRSEDFIEWKLIHNLSSSILSIDIFGPVLETNPLYGPLALTLCENGTPVSCYTDGPNSLRQRITQTSAGGPLGNYIDAFTTRSDLYLVVIATEDFPSGEVAMRLFSLC